jgi:hypothetical protein
MLWQICQKEKQSNCCIESVEEEKKRIYKIFPDMERCLDKRAA